MALKYGSKKGGVQLRSGNGVPFKQMGSSPNKQGIMDIMGFGGGAKQADKFASQTPKVETITIDDSKTEKVIPSDTPEDIWELVMDIKKKHEEKNTK